MKTPSSHSPGLQKIEPEALADNLRAGNPHEVVSASASGSSKNGFSASLASNPFATRFVSPGQVEWIGEEDYFEQLVVRWQSLNCRASIVGVHGAGKSTLLEHLVPLVSEVVWRRDAEGQVLVSNVAGDDLSPERPQAVWLQLRKSASKSMVIPWYELNRGRLLILDGYEQLTRWRRAALIARTKMRGVKLLVTSHRRTILPTLCNLSVSTSTARQIVLQLTAGRGVFATVSDEEIQKCLNAHGGNMREILMDFYDQFEANRSVEADKVKSKAGRLANSNGCGHSRASNSQTLLSELWLQD